MKSSYCVFIAIGSLCFTLGFAANFGVADSINNKKIVCYAAAYACGRPGRGAYCLKHLKPALCTHLIFGYAHLKNDTSVFVLNNWNEYMNGTQNMTEMKQQYPSTKFMVALGGWWDRTDKFSRIAAKSELRKSLATNAVKFLEKYDLDGLDLCWLYPGKRDGSPYDRIGFVQLLKEFKNQFQQYNYTLSALLSASYDTIDAGYDLKEISDTVDFMNMNTYDFSGFWSHDIQPNAPLYSNDRWNVDYAISYMVKLGADPQKIMLGIPLYGRTFISTNTSLSKANLKLGDSFNSSEEVRRTFVGPYTQDVSGVMSYGEICLELLTGEWTRFWDKKSRTPYILRDNILITYDDRESIAAKVEYAIDVKLGGVTASALDLDDFLGDCAKGKQNVDGFEDYLLLRSIGREMERYLNETNCTNNNLSIDANIYNNDSHILFPRLLLTYFMVLFLLFY